MTSVREVEIACEIRRETDAGIAVADGTLEAHNGREREKWFWLPRRLVHLNRNGSVTMPEWLAHEKGLI